MAASTEYALKYSFHIRDIRELKPGDMVSSSCPPTDTLHNGRSVIFSPAGFPLHFSLQLVCAKHIIISDGDEKEHYHQFELQLRLEQPDGVPFLPPLHIQPTTVSGNPDSIGCVTSLHSRHVGPQQPGIWGLTWFQPESVLFYQLPGLSLFPEAGEFRFQLLSEPLNLLAALPSPSSEDWTILPGEMMSAVFRELPLVDRVSARLVCHSWKRILDTDSQAWSNVSHLQSIGRAVVPEERDGYHEGLLNQVRYRKVYEALGFLASRKAPIHSLELNQDPTDLYQGLKHLPSELTKRHVKLKALLFRGNQSWDENADEALVKLIQSQPSLERLYIESFVCFSNATPTLYLAFARLRVLSVKNIGWVKACLPHLTRLDGLRLTLRYSEHEYQPELSNLSRLVESQGLGLRRVKGMDWRREGRLPCLCLCRGAMPVVVWGTGNLSPSAAAFLLMPPHNTGFHRHI